MYKLWVIQSYGPVVSVVTPNCYAAFMGSRVPPPLPPIAYCTICGGQMTVATFKQGSTAHTKCLDGSAEKFEVNMVEALVGWKGWSINNDKLLSAYSSMWLPEKPFEAKCGNGGNCKSPNVACTCGAYAADKRETAHAGKGKVLGQVYGWGRYVRADSGWRAQFAYPKSFFLMEDQVEWIEILKPYRVPIYITQPFKIYDPTEDGYEGEDDGDWKAEEDRHSGAGQESDAEED